MKRWQVDKDGRGESCFYCKVFINFEFDCDSETLEGCKYMDIIILNRIQKSNLKEIEFGSLDGYNV